MNVFLAAYKNELRLSLRDRNPQIIIFIFLILSSLSTLIGWLTVRNVGRIFTDVKALGLTSAPNPFTGVPSLYFTRDNVIYVILVGSLMAIVLGVQSAIRARQSETAILIKSRNVKAGTLYLGQICAIFTILMLALLLTSTLTLISIWMIQGSPMNFSVSLRYFAFLFISWLLLSGLAALGILFGSWAKNEEGAFLNPFVCWSIVVFIIPLAATGVRPIALLNPTSSFTESSGIPNWVHNILNPFMLMEHFKAIGNWLLGLESTRKINTLDFLIFACSSILALTVPYLFANRSLGKKLNV